MRPLVVVGAGGMLGQALRRSFGERAARYLTRAELDLRHTSELESFIDQRSTIINAAAYTQVDKAETDRDAAYAINAEAVRALAEVAERTDSSIIHVSTDYVFNGRASEPYPEDAPGDPASAYGASKWAGEQYLRDIAPQRSIIVRTAWLYGEPGSSFAHTILRAGLTRDVLDVVDDQIGQPTWTSDVVDMIRRLVDSPIRNGVFHATNSGHTSWFGFARALFRHAGWDPERIRPTTSEAFPRPAPRPAWSVLGHQRWQSEFDWTPPHWEDALARAWRAELHAIVGDRG